MSKRKLKGELKLEVLRREFNEVQVDFGVVKLRIARTEDHQRIYLQLEIPAIETDLLAPVPYESDGQHRVYLTLQPRRVRRTASVTSGEQEEGK